MSPLPPSLAVEDEKIPERSDSFVEETWSRAMITIQNEDLEESIDSLKIIVYELDQAKTGTPATIQLLKDSANELVRELQRRLKRVTHSSAHISRRCSFFSLCWSLWMRWSTDMSLHLSVPASIH